MKSIIVTTIATMAMIDSVDNGGSDFDADRVSVPWLISICFVHHSAATEGSDIPLLATCTIILCGTRKETILLVRSMGLKRLVEV
jgi:hypothetical protein